MAAPPPSRSPKPAGPEVLEAIANIVKKGRANEKEEKWAQEAGMPPGMGLRLRRRSRDLEAECLEITGAELERVFKKFDVNGNGALEVSELKAAFDAAGRTASEALIKQCYKKLDTDKDGVISLEEFKKISWHLSMAEASPAPRRP